MKALITAPVHRPVQIIEPAARASSAQRPRSQERQKPLFTDHPDSKLFLVDLLDEHSSARSWSRPETLEMTSRLIEKRLKDFGVEARGGLPCPAPWITRWESSRNARASRARRL
ncbi:hypothetical protein J4711_14490 [Staphylococcus epidermidis]|nr:hypothetical protein [Staphylococcus epidermidis]